MAPARRSRSGAQYHPRTRGVSGSRPRLALAVEGETGLAPHLCLTSSHSAGSNTPCGMRPLSRAKAGRAGRCSMRQVVVGPWTRQPATGYPSGLTPPESDVWPTRGPQWGATVVVPLAEESQATWTARTESGPLPFYGGFASAIRPDLAGPPHADGSVNWWGDRRSLRIALTFDDGPHRTWTPALLKVLAAEDVSATFFVKGDAVMANPRVHQTPWASKRSATTSRAASTTTRRPTAAKLETTVGRSWLTRT